jgi:hypothetical protein
VSWGQMTSLTGVAPVDVYRDLELVRFVAEIDPTALGHGHVYRGLYRESMKGRLPESVRLRRDKALGGPFVLETIRAAQAFDGLTSLASVECLGDLDLVDPKVFAPLCLRWLEELRRGESMKTESKDAPAWRELWPVLAVELFLRRHARPDNPAQGWVAPRTG